MADGQRAFATGVRPVMRWIKADGLDDDVTRAALGAATRVFGSEVDYCVCTVGLDADRVRAVMAWAEQPVEWWPVGPEDNQALADRLWAAGCSTADFGYWWKWFPERVRPHAPEWILDGDMVVVGRPAWFADWASGQDPCRLSQDDSHRYTEIYGQYDRFVSKRHWFYSGLASLPPGARYMPGIEAVMDRRPLVRPHNGRTDMSEQGAIAAAFQRLKARPIPLAEFAFARAFDAHLDFGATGDRGSAWGYHFGNAFVRANPHFDAMVADGTIYSRDEPSVVERFAWLGNTGQWGVPGWSLNDACVEFVLEVAAHDAGSDVLEIGTSRGRIAAMLATIGCHVTTVDHVDRGAGRNLAGLDVVVVIEDALAFLESADRRFSLVFVDLHGNSRAMWEGMFPALARVLCAGGRLVLNNWRLAEIPEWREEGGVGWLVDNLPDGFAVESSLDVAPGVVVLRHDGRRDLA